MTQVWLLSYEEQPGVGSAFQGGKVVFVTFNVHRVDLEIFTNSVCIILQVDCFPGIGPLKVKNVDAPKLVGFVLDELA